MSMVNLWVAVFEGRVGKQTNFKGNRNLHWATLGIPENKIHIYL